MKILNVRNVHEALPAGLELLDQIGEIEETRNGPAIVSPVPVATTYQRPQERVIFWAERDANPFFHLFESLWMLAGREDVEYVGNFVKRMYSFSDDGHTLHGAYGYRWRNWFIAEEGIIDQLLTVVAMLKRDPANRRAVIAMWDASADLGSNSKDVPCNTHIYPRIVNGRLDLTVCCRSNDIVWGAYGANAVHFSYLQEYLVAGIGCKMGQLYQISNNYHVYQSVVEQVRGLIIHAPDPHRRGSRNPYEGRVYSMPLVNGDFDQWRSELSMFMEEGPALGFQDKFFTRVAFPMLKAHQAYQQQTGMQRYEDALAVLTQVAAPDWRLAAEEWIRRRKQRFLQGSDDGPTSYQRNIEVTEVKPE